MELLQGKTGIQIQACQPPNHYPKLCVPPDVASFLPAEQKTAHQMQQRQTDETSTPQTPRE